MSNEAFSLDDQSILITGASGSFGHAIVEEILRLYKPHKLIIFSRDELKQYQMSQRFSIEEYPCLRYFIGNVRDFDRLDMAMQDVDYVVHSAAMKQVPTAEYNPFECIRTNVIGAENVARAAIKNKVKRVIALSTDKAGNPINLYGASKLASDKIFVAANNLSGKALTKFSVVRYGNVIGSRGSIVPFFRKLIAEGASSLPVTDERMTRFWITLKQGVNFVLNCMARMEGGEIFVPKIPSMRVMDLVKALAPDLAVHFVGIRPGEKLHEVMVTEDDSRVTLELPDSYVITSQHVKDLYHCYLDKGAKKVGELFSYRSDNNNEWLTVNDFSGLLGTDGV